jgi:hypothetical protein
LRGRGEGGADLSLTPIAQPTYLRNNFKNTPINLCTDPAVRGLLKVAAGKGALSEDAREEIMQKHLDQLADLEER